MLQWQDEYDLRFLDRAKRILSAAQFNELRQQTESSMEMRQYREALARQPR